MKKQINNLFFLIGLLAVVIMCCTLDVSFSQLWQDITRAGYWLAAILGLWLGLYTLNALTWKVIIRGNGSNCPVPFGALMQLTITGFALNSVTPVGLLGGEAYKIMAASRFMDTQKATSSVILFSMMHIFSHFWFWLSAVAVYLILGLNRLVPMTTLTLSGMVFTILFCSGGIYLFVKGYKYGMTVRFFRFIGRIPGLRQWGQRFGEKHHDDLIKIDRQISELQGQDKRSFYISFFLEYIGRILQSLEIFFMLLLFGIDGGNGGYGLVFIYSFLILAFTSLFANLLGFMPMQVGGREGGFAMSVVQLGMSGEIGIFIGMICRVRELFWTLTGLILIKLGKIQDTPSTQNVNIKKQ